MDTKRTHPSENSTARPQQRLAGKQPLGQQATPGPWRSLLEWLRNGQLFSLLLFLITCSLLVYFFTDPSFVVRQVSVEGNSTLTAEEVVDLANLRGRPIWFAHGGYAVERLTEHAYIVAASVELSLPDRAWIRIEEQRPKVHWQTTNGTYLVDGAGRVMTTTQELGSEDVLVIIDASNSTLETGTQLDLNAIQFAQTLALRLPNELAITPTQIIWDPQLGISVRTASDQVIVFGQNEELDRKLAVLQQLLSDQTVFTYLNLQLSSPFYQQHVTATATPVATTVSP